MLGLVERACSTDDLELEFSLLVNGCGYKQPAAEMAIGFLEHSDFLYMLRRDPAAAGMVLAKGSKAHYSYHGAMQRADASWNDGLIMRDKGALNRYLHRAWDSARNVLGLKRDPSIRSYHAMRR